MFLGNQNRKVVDLTELIAIGGESTVVAYTRTKVVKVVEVMVTEEVLQGNLKHKVVQRADCKRKKNEVNSKRVDSRYVLKPLQFSVQIIGDKTYYLFGKYYIKVVTN